MGLWFFQWGMNLIVVALVFYALRLRREVRTLHFRVAELSASTPGQALASQTMDSSSVNSGALVVTNVHTNKINSPLGATNSTLAERKATQPLSAGDRAVASYEAFERAEEMLAKGVEIKEISRLTGLSLSELRLLGKVSQRSH